MNMRAWLAMAGLCVGLICHPAAWGKDHAFDDTCRPCVKHGALQPFEVCDASKPCKYEVEVRLEGGTCVAKLPYCGLCVKRDVTAAITWTLVNKTGTPNTYAFGSRAKPNEGIELKGARTRSDSGQWLEHFKDKARTNGGLGFEWKRGPNPTWGAATDDRFGHDAIVSETNPDGTFKTRVCRKDDPPIINTVD